MRWKLDANRRNFRAVERSHNRAIAKWQRALPMFRFLRRALFCASLSLIAIIPAAHADAVATVPAPVASPLLWVTYAPDGRTLWSVNANRELVIRARSKNPLYAQNLPGPKYLSMIPPPGDESELYRGPLPQGDARHLQILKDGSFLMNSGVLQWFEPPQRGQSLKLRRAFEGPQEVASRQIKEWSSKERIPRELMLKATGTRWFRAMSLSPDEKRVALSFTTGHSSGAVIFDGPITEIVRVWNLESGLIECEKKFVTRGPSGYILRSSALPGGEKFFPHPNAPPPSQLADKQGSPFIRDDSWAQLGWADDQTLVVAHGLSLRRYDAATGKQVSEWKPDNALKSVTDEKSSQRARRLESVHREESAWQMRIKERLEMQEAFRKQSDASGPWSGNEGGIYIREGFTETAPPPPLVFDATTQQLLALSADGKQLLVWDGAKLLTLWNSATGAVRILVDNAGLPPELGAKFEFSPKGATFSRDGTWVSAWGGHMIRAWSAEKSMTIPMFPDKLDYPGEVARGVALGADMIAFTTGMSFPYRMLYPAPKPPELRQRLLQELKDAHQVEREM